MNDSVKSDDALVAATALSTAHQIPSRTAQRVVFTWLPVHDETDSVTKLTVRITRNDAPKRSYSYAIGTLTDNPDQRYPGFNVLRPFNRLDVEYSVSAHVKTRTSLLVYLMEGAESWVQDDAQHELECYRQRMSNARLEQQIEREQAQLARSKPKAVAGLKTLAKRDAQKYATPKGG